MSLGVHLRAVPSASRWRSLFTTRSLRYAAGVVLIAIGYDVCAQGGEALLLTGPAGAFWPATGVGIAVLYLGGLRWWPGVLLGDLLSREWAQLPLGTALAESAGNIARAVVAAIILRQLIGPRAGMDRLSHVGAVLAAVGIGEAISATVSMLALRAGAVIDGSDMTVFWRSWWLGGVAGGLVVVPLALSWAQPLAPVWRSRGALEGALMLAAVAALSAIALSAEQPLTYLVFPGLIWAALRFGPQGATLAIALAVAAAVWGTSNALGPFVEQVASDSALNLQLYITFAALTTLCLAAIVAERRRAAEELLESRARIAAAGERERRRLEGELHDSAQNRIFALRVKLRLAQERTEETAPELATALGELVEEAGAVGDDLRRIARGLSPPMLATHGLAAALQVEGAKSAIRVDVIASNFGPSEPHIERAVYLCCLESIQNAAKHAGPGATVTVRLHCEADELRFSVEDTGCGFDPHTVTPGAGIASLHDRADTVGGSIELVTAPGRGTTVAGAVPWPARSTRGRTRSA
jgi:signal transduction histidine kinase